MRITLKALERLNYILQVFIGGMALLNCYFASVNYTHRNYSMMAASLAAAVFAMAEIHYFLKLCKKKAGNAE